MTAEDPDVPASRQDTHGCLLVVTGYAGNASALSRATAEAAAAMATSPELGDFFELRFADIGGHPEAAAGRAAAAARVAEELTRPADTAGTNYFALVVADQSAAAAGQLLADCVTHPVTARLSLRCRVLAGTDDRPPGTELAVPAADIVTPAAGAWSRADLVHQLRRYAEELLQDFASGTEPGLTPGQLSELQDEEGHVAAQKEPLAAGGADMLPTGQPMLPLDDVPAPQREKAAQPELPQRPAVEAGPGTRELPPGPATGGSGTPRSAGIITGHADPGPARNQRSLRQGPSCCAAWHGPPPRNRASGQRCFGGRCAGGVQPAGQRPARPGCRPLPHRGARVPCPDRRPGH